MSLSPAIGWLVAGRMGRMREHRLKGLEQPEQRWQVVAPGLVLLCHFDILPVSC